MAWARKWTSAKEEEEETKEGIFKRPDDARAEPRYCYSSLEASSAQLSPSLVAFGSLFS